MSGAFGRPRSVVQKVLEDRPTCRQEVIEQRIGKLVARLAAHHLGGPLGHVCEAERRGPAQATTQGCVVAQSMTACARKRLRSRNDVLWSQCATESSELGLQIGSEITLAAGELHRVTHLCCTGARRLALR